MEYYVDRLDTDKAVCTCENGETCLISREELPDDVFEGCVLREENGAFLLDSERTAARKAQMLALQDSLFGEEAPALGSRLNACFRLTHRCKCDIINKSCGYGEIGRHAGFRIQWSNPCRFEPCYPHQTQEIRTKSSLWETGSDFFF